jgi:hypothetical protein
MYSDTAGVSYENPEPPDAQEGHHEGTTPETELRRVVSYPDTPHGAGPSVPDLMEDMPPPPPAGIDALLSDDPLDPDPLDSDPFDRASLDRDPFDTSLDGDPLDVAPAVPVVTPQPSRPLPPQPLVVTSQPGEEDSGTRRRDSFRIIQGNGGDGQPRRQRVLDVVMDARMRFWRERVAIMLVTGLLFGFLIGNWVVALTLAIIGGIAHAIWRSRSVASIPPGVKLDRAQRITQRKLGRLERAGYRSLHARPIPDSPEIIDHLVVGPTGIYAIDSEKWNRKLPIRTRNGKQLWLGPTSKKDRLEHAKWEAGRAAELLSARLGRDITVRPALAIYGPPIPWDIAVIRDVDVFNGTRLRRYLKRRSKIREAVKISRDEIMRIYDAAEAVLPFTNVGHEVTPVG